MDAMFEAVLARIAKREAAHRRDVDARAKRLLALCRGRQRAMDGAPAVQTGESVRFRPWSWTWAQGPRPAA